MLREASGGEDNGELPRETGAGAEGTAVTQSGQREGPWPCVAHLDNEKSRAAAGARVECVRRGDCRGRWGRSWLRGDDVQNSDCIDREF